MNNTVEPVEGGGEGCPNTIFVSGATGLIGSHICVDLLQRGYKVRAHVRDENRGRDLIQALSNYTQPKLVENLETVALDVLDDVQEWKRVIQGVQGIFHTAISFPDVNNPDFVEKVVNSTVSILKASRSTKTVNRVVLTSSVVTLTPLFLNKDPGHIVKSDEWNDIDVENDTRREEMDVEPRVKRSYRYSAAKTLADKAALAYMNDEHPNFDLVMILPSICIGPVIGGLSMSTVGAFMQFLRPGPYTLRIAQQSVVDIRDCAQVHTEALIRPDWGGKRIIVSGETFTWRKILGILRKSFPERVIAKDNDVDNEPDCQLQFDTTEAKSALVNGCWRLAEISVKDMVESETTS